MTTAADTSCARRRNLVVVLLVVAGWLTFDLSTKAALASVPVGATITEPILGLFQLTLVHNTGAAWGLFGDSTLLLGIFSLIVCVGALVYLFVFAPDSSLLAAVGVALVVAGGIGNAIDRFTNGYVLDFIDLTFMDFPVFNVADIGVTCGVVIFLIALLLEARPKRGNGGSDA